MTPQEVSSKLLAQLRKKIEKNLSKGVTNGSLPGKISLLNNVDKGTFIHDFLEAGWLLTVTDGSFYDAIDSSDDYYCIDYKVEPVDEQPNS